MTALNGVAPAVSAETSLFLQAIVQQIRANDTFGTYRNWNDDLLLKPYVIPKKERREITLEGAVDMATTSRMLAFYRAIAARIEIETGQLAQVVLDINTEGFGWAIIFSGRLILVLKTIRDAHRFGFDTMEKFNAEGEKLIQKGVELAKAHAEVCDL